MPVNYQPRQPPILSASEKHLTLCLLNDMKDRICHGMQFLNSENFVDMLPAFAAFTWKYIPGNFL
jgi:hypothetical protein